MDATLILPKIDREVCTGCGDCVEVCHVNALGIHELKAVIVSAGDCDYCTDCEAVCSVFAISCPFEVVVAGQPPPISPPRWPWVSSQDSAGVVAGN